ncbi:hypothetical protein ACVWWK_003021 [Bradyrhizobium sp. LB9.1b]
MMRVVLGVEDVPQHQRRRFFGLRLQELLAIAEAMAVGDPLHGIVTGAVALDEFGVAEEGSRQHGRAGAVRIGLDRDGQALRLRFRDQHAAALDIGLARRVEMADVHMRAGGAGIADQANVGFRRALGVDARHVGDVGEGRHVLRSRELADRGQLLHAGARRVGVEDADTDAALVQAACEALEDAGDLRIARHVVDPATIAHGVAERLQRAFRVGAGHRADARKGPVGGGAIIQHASLPRLALIPGPDRQHACFEIERRRHAVERLHAVGRDRLAMCVQIDEARCDHEPGRVNHPLGAAERGADRGDLAVHHRHIPDGVHSAGGIHHPAARDHQAAHIVTPSTLNSHQGRFRKVRPPPPMPTHHARKGGQFTCASQTRARSLAAGLPELCFSLHPSPKKGRREDRAPAGTHKNPYAN